MKAFRTSVALVAALCTSSLSAQNLCEQAIHFGGLNSDTNLGSWGAPVLDEWLQENAQIVIGSENGISPYEGDGMLRMQFSGGNTSQVRQRIDVSGLGAMIATGDVQATFYGRFTGTHDGVRGGVLVSAHTPGGQMTVSDPHIVDGSGTWIQAKASVQLPSDTTHVEVQFHCTNNTVNMGELAYGDDGYLIFSLAPTATSYQGTTPGSILNPDELSSTPAILGQPLTFTVTPQADRAGTPGLNVATILVTDSGPPASTIVLDLAPLLLGFGDAPLSQLLVSGTTLAAFNVNLNGPGVPSDPASFVLPNNPALLCFEWYAQAIVLGNVTTDAVNDLDPMFSSGMMGMVGAL